jgi:hypothetical protein
MSAPWPAASKLGKLLDYQRPNETRSTLREKKTAMRMLPLTLAVFFSFAVLTQAQTDRLSLLHEQAYRGCLAIMEERGLVTPIQVSDAVDRIKKVRVGEELSEQAEAFRLGLFTGAVVRLSLFYGYRDARDEAMKLAQLYCRLVRISQHGLGLSDADLDVVLGEELTRKFAIQNRFNPRKSASFAVQEKRLMGKYFPASAFHHGAEIRLGRPTWD